MGVSARQIEAHAHVFDNLLGRIDGRIYYDLVNWRRALALFPGFKSNSAFMDQMMGLAEPFPTELANEIAPRSPHRLSRFLDSARLGRVALGLLVNAIALEGASKRFRKRLNRALAAPDAVIDKASSHQLVREYRRLEYLLLSRWDAPLINDFLCMIAFGASRRALEAWSGEAGLSLHSDIMIGQGDIVSAEPARLITAMGKLARRVPHVVDALAAGDADALAGAPGLEPAFAAYLRKFGDRCVQELKLESIPLHEDPTPLLRAVAAAARKDQDALPSQGRPPDPHSEVHGAARLKARGPDVAAAPQRLRRLFKNKPVKRMVAACLLSYAKARVRDRENLRFERTRLFGRVRRIFRTLGVRLTETGVLDHPRDIFYLTIDEALNAAEPNAARGLNLAAARRRAEDAGSAARPDPPERIDTAQPFRASTANNHDNVRRGLACCAGSVVARVRVIADPRMELPDPGEILVARATDPGWIAAFVNAAGIIAERGSLLSHSAIVARELGVPCVVGLKGATEWLRSGDLVRLDGAAGTVELIEP
jgi:pyruvate,water dikinase